MMIILFLIISSIFLFFFQFGFFSELFSSALHLNLLLFFVVGWFLLSTFRGALWLAVFVGFLADLWFSPFLGPLMFVFTGTIIVLDFVFIFWFHKKDKYSFIWAGILLTLISFGILWFLGLGLMEAHFAWQYILINMSVFPFFFLLLRYLDENLLYVFRL